MWTHCTAEDIVDLFVNCEFIDYPYIYISHAHLSDDERSFFVSFSSYHSAVCVPSILYLHLRRLALVIYIYV